MCDTKSQYDRVPYTKAPVMVDPGCNWTRFYVGPMAAMAGAGPIRQSRQFRRYFQLPLSRRSIRTSMVAWAAVKLATNGKSIADG
jgi:hypothetical protein